jgi:hypothetical protein
LVSKAPIVQAGVKNAKKSEKSIGLIRWFKDRFYRLKAVESGKAPPSGGLFLKDCIAAEGIHKFIDKRKILYRF